jgi:uncharacterized membrane protein (UPF0136 family)
LDVEEVNAEQRGSNMDTTQTPSNASKPAHPATPVPQRPWLIGALLVAAGLLVPLASVLVTNASGQSIPAAVVAIALLTWGVHRLVWTRTAPFPAWQRVLISLVIGTLGYCLVWVMPSQLLALLGGALKS